MKDSFLHVVWDSFKKIWGIPASILSFIVGFLLWIYTPNSTVALKIAIPILIVLLLLIITFFDSVLTMFKKNKQNKSPQLLICQKYHSNNELILLLSPCENFSHDSLVTIYSIQEQQYEQLIALGVVINIQEDKKIQVLITRIFVNQDETIKKIEENNKTAIERIIVKPNFPKSLLAFQYN